MKIPAMMAQVAPITTPEKRRGKLRRIKEKNEGEWVLLTPVTGADRCHAPSNQRWSLHYVHVFVCTTSSTNLFRAFAECGCGDLEILTQ